MEFGKIELNQDEERLYDVLNQEIINIGKRLPEPLRNLGGIFLMEYGGWMPGESFDFFANYYPPSYTILYWIKHYNPKMNETVYFLSVRVQALAMFLHSLDDHLCDSQLSTDILKLHLRTEAWNMYIELAEEMCINLNLNQKIISSFTNDYFLGMTQKDPNNLEGYLSRFRKQWATWILSPGILILGLGGEQSLEKCKEMYESFGLAWRLMDDLQDWQKDFHSFQISAIYYFLPENLKEKWKDSKSLKDETVIFQFVEKEYISSHILKLISSELKNSIWLANELGFAGLAKEFESMTHFRGIS